MASEEFVLLVESLELQNLPLSKSNYTFFEGGTGCACSMLDRFLAKCVDSGWSERVVQHVIFKFSSDHLPILLTIDMGLSKPRPFHFVNIWVEHPEFWNVINEEWDTSGVLGWNLWGQLKSIEGVVRRWQGNQFSNKGNRIMECEEALKRILVGGVSKTPGARFEFQMNKGNLFDELKRRNW